MENVKINGIEYRQSNGVFKNSETNMTMAYFSRERWMVLERALPSADVPLKKSFRRFIDHLNSIGATPSEDIPSLLLAEFPKLLKNEQCYYNNQSVDNSLLALEVERDKIKLEQAALISLLEKHGVKAHKIEDPHISIFYLNSSVPIQVIQEEISNASAKSWVFKIKSVKILQGLMTPRDYICLELSAPEEFYSFIQQVNESTGCNKLQFPGGFQAHISLLFLERGEQNEEDIEKINKCLCSYELKISPTIRPQYVSLFNKDKSVEIRKKCRNARK